MDDPIRILITEDDLRADEGHFRSVYENAMIGMYRTTPEGRILSTKGHSPPPGRRARRFRWSRRSLRRWEMRDPNLH